MLSKRVLNHEARNQDLKTQPRGASSCASRAQSRVTGKAAPWGVARREEAELDRELGLRRSAWEMGLVEGIGSSIEVLKNPVDDRALFDARDDLKRAAE